MCVNDLSAVQDCRMCLFMLPQAVALHLQLRGAHIYQQSRLLQSRGYISAERWQWAVFIAICANGPVYTVQDSSVKRGRRRATL